MICRNKFALVVSVPSRKLRTAERLSEVNPGNADYPAFSLSERLDYNKFFLSEHHLYGSSRLGVKTYWPTQYQFLWDAGLTVSENENLLSESQFSSHRPWFSYVYNSLITAGSKDPYGHGQSSALYSERVLGQKRYELTNHLGNVQAVITDKQTDVAVVAGAGLPSPVKKRASLFAAYDHYPFGMLMPERYIEDNTVQCTPITRPYYVKKQTGRVNIEFTSLSNASLFLARQGTTTSISVGVGDHAGSLRVLSEGSTAQVSLPVSGFSADNEITVTTFVRNNNREAVRIGLEQQQGDGLWKELGHAEVLYEEVVTIKGMAGSSMPVQVVFKGTGAGSGTSFEIGVTLVKTFEELEGSYVYMDCNEDEAYERDYRFGFNGQEKVNEISGVGNHNTALFWEYNTRLGRRWNLDPKPQVNISDYAAFRNNPIFNNDVLGDQATGFDARNNAMRRLLAEGKITNEQYQNFLRDNAIGGAIGGAALLTLYTGGRALPLLQRVGAWALMNQQTVAAIGGLTASLLDPDPGSTVDYPGGFDDIARGVKLLFKNTQGAERFIFNTNRLNFFFGRGTGTQRNIEKSLQRASDFMEMGINETKEGFDMLTKYADQALEAPAMKDAVLNKMSGKYEVWKTVDVVEGGKKKGTIQFGFAYPDKDLKGTPELMTAIPMPSK